MDILSSASDAVYKFKVRSFFGPRTDVYHDSNEITITVSCAASNSVTSTFLDSNRIFYQNSTDNNFYFAPFTCSYAACC